MCLDVTDFMKDNMNVSKDLATLYDHSLLEAETNAKGNLSRLRVPYYLNPPERKEILKWLKTLIFWDHYATKIKWAVNVSTSKLNDLKSHDYHIIIERLMSMMFFAYFKGNLWKMLAEFSYFYRQICAKQVSKAMMQKLEKQISLLVCKMEKVFSPCDATFASAFTLGS
jgi:hypothetical protein